MPGRGGGVCHPFIRGEPTNVRVAGGCPGKFVGSPRICRDGGGGACGRYQNNHDFPHAPRMLPKNLQKRPPGPIRAKKDGIAMLQTAGFVHGEKQLKGQVYEKFHNTMKQRDPRLYFKGKYRIPSARLPGWSYRDGEYFVTANTKSYGHPFGEVVDGCMVLSPAGRIAEAQWMAIAVQFPYVELDEFVVMPNHFHALLRLAEVPGITHPAPCGGCTGLHNPAVKPGLGAVMRWFKATTTYRIRQQTPDFCWQRLYYDVIIRHAIHARRVRRYIRNNPARWKKSPFCPTSQGHDT